MTKQLIGLISSIVALVMFFFLVEPEGKPLVYIFFPVVLVWIFLFCTVQIVLALIFKNRSLLRTIISFVGVSMAVLLLLLSGVNQLTPADIILSSSLVVITSFYFYRMWS